MLPTPALVVLVFVGSLLTFTHGQTDAIRADLVAKAREELAALVKSDGPLAESSLRASNDLAKRLLGAGTAASIMESEALFRSTLASQTSTLGANHKATLASLSNLAYLLEHHGGDLEEAYEYAVKAADGFAFFYGEDHTSTKLVKRNLDRLQKRMGKQGWRTEL